MMNVNKIWLVLKREYLVRVRSKTFIISTFLTPLFFVGLIAAITYFTAQNPDKSAAVTDTIIENGPIKQKEEMGVAYLAGYISSFLIYITILIYGTMVMRGVSEEKTNRIAEIIISSVKPFELMMGKILGIGAVGLTQFVMWLVLIVLFSSVAFLFLPSPDMAEAAARDAQQTPALLAELSRVNLPLMIGSFIFYFIFGYLFYASLFAAVGSAVSEDAQDSQSLMFPVTMPIILAIAFMTMAINAPSGSLAIWTSLVPFFSPVVMMARLPFGVPFWQLAASMLLLVGGFLFTTWLSAKIYRTGILLYGKKITWREMWKWTVRS
jgi:ABC-2 type transport system permease protein